MLYNRSIWNVRKQVSAGKYNVFEEAVLNIMDLNQGVKFK